jgi:hypothetical protein
MQPQNLRTEAHVELKKANNEWTTCIAKTFMPAWLQGDSLSIEDVCVEQREKMTELTEAVYGEKPMPFKAISSAD